MTKCIWCFEEIRPGEGRFHGDGFCYADCQVCDELNLRVCTHAINKEREVCNPLIQEVYDRRFRTLNEARMQTEFRKALINGIDVERTDTGGVRITHAYRERMKRSGIWTFGEVKQTM